MLNFIKTLLASMLFTFTASAQTAPAPANPTVPAPTTSNAPTNAGVPNSSAFGTVNSGANPSQPAAVNPNTGTSTATPNTATTTTTTTTNKNVNGATFPGSVSSGGTTTGAVINNSTGITSAQIRSAQNTLNSSGFSVGTIDGKMGNRTTDAIRGFQRSRGLNETGIFDQPTLDALQVPSSDDRAPASVNQ